MTLNKARPLLKNMIKKPLYPMLKRYQRLDPLFENVIINWDVDEECSLEIFEMTTITNEQAKELVSREFLL